jgi:hypothetical protein
VSFNFNHIETHLIIHKILELGRKEIPFWEVIVHIQGGDVLSGKRKRLFDLILTHGSEISENNHALCVYESIGNNPRFIHSTDLQMEIIDSYFEQKKNKGPILMVIHTPMHTIGRGFLRFLPD